MLGRWAAARASRQRRGGAACVWGYVIAVTHMIPSSARGGCGVRGLTRTPPNAKNAPSIHGPKMGHMDGGGV